MKFMKEQEHEILKLEGGELILKKFPNAIGEVMLYDGSFRIAINPETWNIMKNHAIEIVDVKLKRYSEDNTIQNHITHNCKSGVHKYCQGKSNAWGECVCECHSRKTDKELGSGDFDY